MIASQSQCEFELLERTLDRAPIPLTSRTRELAHTVLNGDHTLLPVLCYLASYRRYDQILTWLVQNRMTGYNFRQWIALQWGNRLMGMAQEILRRIDRDTEVKPIFYGKDFV
jgi:hypothetical protein